MAKRHHQSKKARHNEHMGMERYERGPVKHHGHHAMHHERHSGAMINDDWSAPALLPQHVIERYYPAGHQYGMHMVDDLFDGVQKQMHEDAMDFKKAFSPKKY